MPMKRRYRLRSPQDFARLKAEGQVTKHPMMLMSVLPNNLPYNRYGVITGKRLGNAVIRNRTRRVFSEGLHVLHPQLSPGMDMVFVLRQVAVGASLISICQALADTFRRANLLSEE